MISDSKFTVKDISVLLGMSERTVKNRMKEHGLSAHSFFSDINDEMLDAMVARGLRIFPRAGEYLMHFSKT